jgi:hypothetical protein
MEAVNGSVVTPRLAGTKESKRSFCKVPAD